VSATCQHRLGHYSYKGTRVTDEETKLCGKAATHVAEYPNHKPFHLCRKHAKTRQFVREITTPACVPVVCEWVNDCGNWEGSCGVVWEFTAGGPIENEVKFCVNCGKPVQVKGGGM